MIQLQAEYAYLQGMYADLEERLELLRSENEGLAYKLGRAEEQVEKVTL